MNNYENFTFSKDQKDIIFHFEPFKVAPYSSGIIEESISLEQLKPYFR